MTSPDLKAQSKASPLFSSPATLLLSKDQTANVDLALFPSEIRWDSFQGKPASNFQAKLTISGCLPFSLCASSRTLPSHASLSSIFGVSFSTRPALSRRSKRWNRLLKTFLKDPTTYVTVHAFRKDNDRARPVYLPTTFEFATLEVASAWVEKASNLVHFGRVDDNSKRRKVLVIVNPFSGTEKSPIIFANCVAPILTVGGLDYEVQETTHPNHAFEIAQSIPIGKYIRVVTISGDGLLFEVVNGLMKREDWAEAVKIPVVPVSGGTGNAMSKCLDCSNPIAGALTVVKGIEKPLDVIAVTQVRDGVPVTNYSILSISWAFIADVDIESEKLRWAGSLRNDIYAIIRMLNPRNYSASVYYLPAHGETAAASTLHKSKGPPLRYLDALQDLSALTGRGWEKSVYKDYFFWMVTNVSWISREFLCSPGAKLNDGHGHLIMLPGNVPARKFLPTMLDQGNAGYLKLGYSTYTPIKAFVLSPETSANGRGENGGKGIIAIDGEAVPTQPVVGEVLEGVLRIVTPPWLDESRWERDLTSGA